MINRHSYNIFYCDSIILYFPSFYRFTVEHIADTLQLPDNSIHWRNAQKIEKAMAGKVVSRSPELSSIEEANTVNSITQVLPKEEDGDDDDVFVFREKSSVIKTDVIVEENE